jgi:Asp-tRNA(Asn)/Glu-tRNA(Gln) amidotransferase A subunit family amidase
MLKIPIAHLSRLAGTLAALAIPGAALAQTSRAPSFDVVETTIAAVHSAMDAQRLTCRQLIQSYLDRIAAYDKSAGTLALNSIQTVNPRALAEADSLDAVLRSGQSRGPLHCVAVVVKDQVETKDMPTTFGSALFKDFVPTRDATVVQRLRAAGAIILAKTTMGEFAAWHVSSAAGIIRNAYDPTRHPSGSSSGSGTAIAANFGLVGIGEDTGGSIRGPAAVHSLVGLRPTVPLVSRFGMLPSNPTQDTMGPMARTVADAARVLNVIAGYDPNDPITAYSVGHIPPSYTDALHPSALRGARIGIVRARRRPPAADSSGAGEAARAPASRAAAESARRDSLARDSVEFAKVRVLFDRAAFSLGALGATVVDSIMIDAGGPRFRNNFETEEATDRYLAQHPNAPYKTLKEILLAGGVNSQRARALIGLVGHSTRDPGFGTLLQNREALRIEILKIMADQKLDALIYATFDAPPSIIPADILVNPRAYSSYGYTRGDNRFLSATLGWPAITVPMGFTSDSLPAGLEFLGRPFSEAKLLAFAYAYEQATKLRRPPRTTPRLALAQ